MGKIFALLAALAYGATTTLSRLAYDTGTTPISLTFYRYGMITVIMLGVMVVLRKPWRADIPPRLFVGCVLGWYAISLGHLGAVRYIPVSLAAIVFYTYPLQVIAYRRWINNAPVTKFEASGFVLAFVGLVIALGPEFHQVDWRGLVMALSGAVGALVFLICYEAIPAETDAYAATMWITLGTLVLCLLSVGVGFEIVPPEQPVGWVYLWAIAALTVLAFIFMLFAIKKMGASLTALYLNLEPVVILLVAWFVLNEQLSFGRLLGVFLVVASLLISRLPLSKKPIVAR